MAYAALVSLEEIIIDKVLQDHDDQDSNISFHEKQQIKCLHEHLIFLQAFLEDFPERAIGLEARMRDAANQAEDITEYFMSEEIQSARRPPELRLRYDFQKLNQELQKVTEEIDSITREAMEMKNSTTTEDVQLSEYSSIAASSSDLASTSKDAVVGFDDDLLAVKARLCGESQNLEVIPIFGMGGIGKTTLAKNAYDDPLIMEHFDIRSWVTVSQDYSAQEILSDLLDSMKVERSEDSNEQIMRDLLYKSLKGRRYLIVMDDMWSTKAWDTIKMMFPDDLNGSRIILTTRLADVAAYPDPSSPLHEMHLMDMDQSWNLLQQKVFVGESCPLELETIGKTIARSCTGLPLAIVLVAGVLSTVSKTQESWEKIAKRVNLAINTTNNEQFVKVLSLSYIHLPHHLRPCFLYMGIFREDYEIRVSKLIKLWMAEGFLKPTGSKSFEEAADEYLEDLVKRSLVLVSSRKSNGKLKGCSVHDLVRDLCIRKAQEEKFFLNLMGRNVRRNSWKSIKNQRRIIVAGSTNWVEYCSTIRTMICFKFPKSLGNFKLLRVLDALAVKVSIMNMFSKFPRLQAQVFKLFHLRYLAFTCGLGFVLPPSILNLQNLQTLIIIPSGRIRINLLPLEIWRMPQLRHLSILGTLPDPEGAATFALENLQTLSGLKDFKCTEEILKMIPNIKTLDILYYQETNVQESHLENLVYLHRLEKVTLRFNLVGRYQGKLNVVFPTGLKKLVLGGWGLRWKDMSTVGLLPNLEVLKLRDYACVGHKWKTIEGEFPQLKFLLIKNSNLQHWITKGSHFPSLKCLLLYDCRYLSEVPDGIGEIQTLELIEVDDSNKSLVDSAKRIQEEQRETCGDTALQVHIGNRY